MKKTMMAMAMLMALVLYGCSDGGGDDGYQLGDTGPGGGKIFYVSEAGFSVDGTTCHYLEAAPADMDTSLAWASAPNYNTFITDTGGAIGTGKKNTALILATDADAPAAKACNEYSNGGKSDWFLPSTGELNKLYENRTHVGNLTGVYWSSTQHGASDYAWAQRFSDGLLDGSSKVIDTGLVRAVRAF